MAQSRIRVLLIDDDRDDILLVRELLARRGGSDYEVEGVMDYESAIDRLGERRHDVALVDFRLGGRDGLELIKEVTATGSPIPLILLTGWGDHDVDLAATEAGAVDYLSKRDLDANALDRSIRYAVQRAGVERALRTSEQFVRSVLDSLDAHVAVIDHQGRILAVNGSWREFARCNGASELEVCEGADYLKACEFSGEEGQAFARGIREVLAGEVDSFSFEYACHSPDRKRWFTGRVTPLRGDHRPLHAVISHVDVTKRRLSEDALRESESVFHSFFDGAPLLLGIVETLDRDLRLVSANTATERYFTCTKEGLDGRLVSELGIPQQTIDLWLEKAKAAELTGEPVTFAYVDEREKGPRWMDAIVCRIGPFGDGPQRFACLVEDITDRHNAEDALRSSEARYRLLAENATDMISRLSPAGVFLYASPASQALLGYSPEELAGRSLYDLIHPGDLARVNQAFREFVQSRQPGRVTFRSVRGDGSQLWLETTCRAISEPTGGSVVELQCTSRDVSERVRAGDDVRKLNDQLKLRLERINALRSIDVAITASSDVRHTLGLVAEQARLQLGVDVAVVRIFGVSEEEAIVSHGDQKPGDLGNERDVARVSALVDRVVHERKPLYINDLALVVAQWPEAASLAAQGYAAYHAFPLISDGLVNGVLELLHREPNDPEPEWLDFADAVTVQATIAINRSRLVEGLCSANDQLARAYDATIEGWARVLDLRDKETEGHSRRVTELTVSMARAMGLEADELVHIRRGALLHDIGKMGIPDGILLKPGPLTVAEREIMEQHPGLAVEMLWPIEFLRPALEIPYCHHERWDGTGYPRKLAREAIPLPARIFAAVDIWDALIHDRPYRKAWPRQTVLEHIRSLAGSHLDPHVVEVFLSLQAETVGAESNSDGPENPLPMDSKLPRHSDERSSSSASNSRRAEPLCTLPQVLLVVPDENTPDGLIRVLQSTGYEVILASNGELAWRLFREGSFRLVVAESSLPGMEGLELCRRIRGLAERPYTYLMLVTEHSGAERRLAGRCCGVDDFLLKPIDLLEVAARLESARRILEVQDRLVLRAQDAERGQIELRRQNERLTQMVVKDPMTSLYNRQHLLEVMDAQLSLSSRRGDPLSVVLIDLDLFSQFNKDFGDQAGDDLLRFTARLLKANVRSHDLVSRSGDDEFVILLPGTPARESVDLAVRLQLALADCAWPPQSVTFSIGVATLSTAPWDRWLLMGQAERALRRSKEAGRNRVTHHDLNPIETPPIRTSLVIVQTDS